MKKVLIACLGLIFSLMAPLVGHAEEIRFLHDSRTVTLASPGTEIGITVRLQGTRSLEHPLEIELIRDGLLTYITVPVGKYNDYEEPSYTFNVASPSAGLGYRFHITDEAGKTWSSPHYFVLQECELPLSTATTTPSSDELKVDQLARQAKKLEHQLSSHALSSKRLTQLREILGLQGGL